MNQKLEFEKKKKIGEMTVSVRKAAAGEAWGKNAHTHTSTLPPISAFCRRARLPQALPATITEQNKATNGNGATEAHCGCSETRQTRKDKHHRSLPFFLLLRWTEGGDRVFFWRVKNENENEMKSTKAKEDKHHIFIYIYIYAKTYDQHRNSRQPREA